MISVVKQNGEVKRMIYKCPKCGLDMVCFSTMGIPPRYYYKCSCGFQSKVISGDQEVMTLPKKWWADMRGDEDEN